jgi:hypothetical protein
MKPYADPMRSLNWHHSSAWKPTGGNSGQYVASTVENDRLTLVVVHDANSPLADPRSGALLIHWYATNG